MVKVSLFKHIPGLTRTDEICNVQRTQATPCLHRLVSHKYIRDVKKIYAYQKTLLPSTKVMMTFASFRASGGRDVISRSITQKSAVNPGTSLPLRSSAKDA